jgi:hypothetical protein
MYACLLSMQLKLNAYRAEAAIGINVLAVQCCAAAQVAEAPDEVTAVMACCCVW